MEVKILATTLQIVKDRMVLSSTARLSFRYGKIVLDVFHPRCGVTVKKEMVPPYIQTRAAGAVGRVGTNRWIHSVDWTGICLRELASRAGTGPHFQSDSPSGLRMGSTNGQAHRFQAVREQEGVE